MRVVSKDELRERLQLCLLAVSGEATDLEIGKLIRMLPVDRRPSPRGLEEGVHDYIARQRRHACRISCMWLGHYLASSGTWVKE